VKGVWSWMLMSSIVSRHGLEGRSDAPHLNAVTG
jgi:hypothetical protein